ncbi:MAG: histidinol-phosphate aminotransferase family protein [Nitrospirae bacterium]|nr:histidinol-phosphate aminotransferase family protein [Nitrospirota bacterium]
MDLFVKGRQTGSLRVAIATDQERDIIYRLRHDVYARELGQHSNNPECKLTDSLDAFNIYITVSLNGETVGFISVTPPGGPSYSIDKYVQRRDLPFVFDDRLYEIRLFTVIKPYRGSQIANVLMYAAFRWIESHGGTRIMAIGRLEVLDIYLKVGLQPVGIKIQSGGVQFEVLTATVDMIRRNLACYAPILRKLKDRIDWQLGIPFEKPAECFHGGAFFDAIGEEFDALERSKEIINADVLDAWFPPAPRVLTALQEYLSWLLRTSPPTGCEGLIQAIAGARNVDSQNILPGAGSSDLIFRAFRQWLKPDSRVLILDPTYGEYAHVLERVIGCRVDRLNLSRRDGYRLDPAYLESYFDNTYDLIVLVNPNSPTGRHVAREQLEPVLKRAPVRTRIWIDETYIEYAGSDQSLEQFAAKSENVIVCKSMSKVYALSGARVAYLCASPHQLEELRAITPPWAVSLPAQVAAVMALQDPEYYAERYRETHRLRAELVTNLSALNAMEIVPGVANFVLCHLPPEGPDAATVCDRCRANGLFLRNTSSMSSRLGNHALRIAVKDAETNRCMVEILNRALHESE